MSRVGNGPHTGIDRVEAAYLRRFLDEPEPLFALVQTRFFNALLDRDGTRALAARLFGEMRWGRPSLAMRLRRKMKPAQRAAESDVRRLSIAVSRKSGLAAMFGRHLPKGTAYIAVGQGKAVHEGVFDAIKAVERGRVHVLLHDTIPLDHPDYMTPRSASAHAQMMRAISAKADLVICNSDATRQSAERHFEAMGRVPPMISAHLGIDMPREPDATHIPARFDLSRPYFVVLGTIEPRKNHALLLDIWERFDQTLPAGEIPKLAIVGQRGWMNEALFERLDASPVMERHVFEFSGLDDRAVAALIQGARALLMPSFAEGFGLPPGEALLLGTPAIVNDLDIYREVFGNNLIYARVSDMYSWSEAILRLSQAEKNQHKAAVGADIGLPTWQEHFNLVLKVT
ncbi:glycosyltransferase family 4 protein [Sinisalibacter aestuarii]|nr:glycosyltransferase family 1 protein [Sinisalibacter aestuarii]